MTIARCKVSGLLGLLLLLTSCGIKKGLNDFPQLVAFDTVAPQVFVLNDSTRYTDHGFITKNKQQLWELYVQGDPYQIGLNMGVLTEELYRNQERIFFSKVEEFVPSGWKQNMLIRLLKYYNRHLYRYVSPEYKTEIYGIARYGSSEFDYLGDAYHRNLYLHGAHDIGHAFQDLALVGCSSLAVWNQNSEDGKLLIGRNFDFYAGDAFAENKIIAFVKPDQGYAFMSVTWGGMIGVVSGMNEKGLTVTLNAGKSSIPFKAKTPISLVAREIVQYASNIEEAIAIAKEKEVFVSESIMVGSAEDGKAVLIEIAPKKTGIYDVPNTSSLVCSNHFQSDAFKEDRRNQRQIAESHSQYRWDKLQESVASSTALNPVEMVKILRDTKGLEGKQIGYGNEKALNQLLAHHGIVFQPEKRMVWVSSNPYQLGEFVAYDLNDVFSRPLHSKIPLGIDSLTIAKDPFLESKEYADYEEFRITDRRIEAKIAAHKRLLEKEIEQYQKLNPEYWLVYYRIGVYYYNREQYEAAKKQFETALSKEVTTQTGIKNMNKYLRKIKRKWR